MAPKATSDNLPSQAGDPEAERRSLELLETLLDLTTNVLTGLPEVGGREIRPVAGVRPLVRSLRTFSRPHEASMSDRLRAAVVAKRRDILTAIARSAPVIVKRLASHRSPAAGALCDLWRQVGTLASGVSTELDLLPLERRLRTAVSGPLCDQVGYHDPLKFRDDILTLRVGIESERKTVLKRWAAQIARTWHPKDPRVRRLLQEDDPSASFRLDALYAGLYEAVTESTRRQHVRLGTKWIKDHNTRGKPSRMRVEPAYYLSRWGGPEQYWLWLRRRAIERAEQYLVGVADDEFLAATERTVKRYGDGLRTRTKTPDILPAAHRRSLEDAALRTEQGPEAVCDEEAEVLPEDPRPARLERLLEVASPAERGLLEFWKRHPEGVNAPSREAAKALHSTPAAVRKLKERLLRRARKQL